MNEKKLCIPCGTWAMLWFVMRRFLLLLGLCWVWTGCSKGGDVPPPSIPRRPAPDFSSTEVRGNQINSRDLRGKWVVVNIWASWCPPCVREIPDFVQLQEKWREKGVQFIGISVDEGGIKIVRPFVERMGINYPVLLSDVKSVRKMFGPINAIPTTFIIDPNWNLVDRHTGLLSQDVLEEVLKGFTSGKRVAQAASTFPQ